MQPSPPTTNTSDENDILLRIAEVGNKIRDLKSNKANKSIIEAEVKILLALKGEYKLLTGKEWKPGTVASTPIETPVNISNNTPDMTDVTKVDTLITKINEQGNIVRNLKTNKGSKVLTRRRNQSVSNILFQDVIDAAVKILLDLKVEYKNLTGTDFPVAGRSINKQSREVKPQQVKVAKSKQAKANLPELISDVIKADVSRYK